MCDPVSVVVMGVSGAGKSTVGKLLAEAMHCDFIDADDYHPQGNKVKMTNGIPLTDDDRMPWLSTLGSILRQHQDVGLSVVLACSALKPSYRQQLRKFCGSRKCTRTNEQSANAVTVASHSSVDLNGCSNNVFAVPTIELGSRKSTDQAMNVQESPSLPQLMFIHLSGPAELFAKRVAARFEKGEHFMHPALVNSQMDLIHVDDTEIDVFRVSADILPEEVVCHIFRNVLGRIP